MWARAWDWFAGLFDSPGGMLVGIGLILLAIVLPIAYLVGKQRTGDAETAVRERVESFVTSLADGEGGSACEMLSDEARRAVVRRVNTGDGAAESARSCEEAVRVAAARRYARETEALRSVEVLEVDYEEDWTPPLGESPGNYKGADATARLREGEVELRTESAYTDDADNWTIESANPILLSLGGSDGP